MQKPQIIPAKMFEKHPIHSHEKAGPGTFRIHATSFNQGIGVYTLTVREAAKPPKEEKK